MGFLLDAVGDAPDKEITTEAAWWRRLMPTPPRLPTLFLSVYLLVKSAKNTLQIPFTYNHFLFKISNFPLPDLNIFKK